MRRLIAAASRYPPYRQEPGRQNYSSICRFGGLLQAQQLDELVKRYDPLSAGCPALDFQQVQGMLKGFIDSGILLAG